MKTNAKEFIADFKALHDATHSIVEDVAVLCATLFDIEYFFLDGNYATDLDGSQSALTTFFDGYSVAYVTMLGYFDSIVSNCDLLLQKGGDFLKNNNLACGLKFF